MSEFLKDHTTLRVGGPAREFVVASTEADLIAATRTDQPLLILSGGSNLVVSDSGFDGRVVKVATKGIVADVDHPDDIGCLGATSVKVAAGESWDDLVATAGRNGWVGIEALSGIPGLAGATPIQNVGAYGQEVASTIAQVRTWDRLNQTQRTFAAAECGFGYRTSRFKADPQRYLILEVTFLFKQGTLSAPIAYSELAQRLGVELGERAPLVDVRRAVLDLRASKGMVLDDSDHDTWSAGSFFTNPVIAPERVPEGAPAWPQPDGTVKTSAAWLIDHAGFSRGYPEGGSVTLSTKHPLAITNRGGANAADVLELARVVRAGVADRFGIELVNEPVFVGLDLLQA